MRFLQTNHGFMMGGIELNNLDHNWNVDPKEAISIQKKLARWVDLSPMKNEPKIIAGVDVSMNWHSTTAFAGFVLLSFPELKVIEQSMVRTEIIFPYIPGLLSFREIPSLLKVWKNLKLKPDLIFVDGIGIAHPRRFGIASHLGVILDVPTIGCAKKLLTGIYAEPKEQAGNYSYIHDRNKPSEIIGAMVRTKTNVKPMNISPGHRISLDQAIHYTFRTTLKYRIPEPTRRAHILMNQFRVEANEPTLKLL